VVSKGVPRTGVVIAIDREKVEDLSDIGKIDVDVILAPGGGVCG
jgi:hypothetical protein